MSILKYKVLNPISDRKKPYLSKNGFFYFYTDYKNFKYILECSNVNENTKNTEYLILLGEYKFDKNCRMCQIDNYGRCKFKPKGELKNYIEREIAERGNVEVNEINNDGVFITYLIV